MWGSFGSGMEGGGENSVEQFSLLSPIDSRFAFVSCLSAGSFHHPLATLVYSPG